MSTVITATAPPSTACFTNASISLELNVLTALKQPLVQRCNALSAVIQEALNSNTKDIQNYFTLIIENIFNFGSQMSAGTSWNLRTIFRAQDPSTFDAVYSFLHPNGALFALIKHVMFDPSFKCFFPINCLPLPSKLTIDKGIVPDFYVNKIVSDSFSSHNGQIALNALEFYLFHFAYYIRDEERKEPYILDYVNGGSSPSTVLYIALLETYLNVFLPLDVNQINSSANQSQTAMQGNQSLWKSLSSTTSNLLHLGSSANTSLNQTVTANQPGAFFPRTTLLNLRPFINVSHNDSQLVHHVSEEQKAIHSLGSITWKAETILHIFAEMLLNIYHPTVSTKISPTSYINPVVTPNTDHVRCVRVFVKHLHYFSNSALNKGQSFMNATTASELDSIKSSVWSSRYPLQKHLYCFLRWCFDHWPLDGSFRLPMETWLSYIQPWRYVDIKTDESRSVESDDVSSSSPSTFESSQRWKAFISDNLLFYTMIFNQTLQRFSRLDLTSSKNSLMLARVTKIMCQAGLLNLLKEVEDSLENLCSSNSFNWSASRGSLLNPHLRSPSASHNQSLSYRHHLEMECETSDFVYVSLSSSRTRTELERLIVEIVKSRSDVNRNMEQMSRIHEQESPQGFLATIRAIFADDYSSFDYKQLLSDKQKAEAHLTASLSRLTEAFGISVPEASSEGSANQTASNGTATTADMILDESGLTKLTDVGRYQILNKLREPVVGYQGNPDTQPVKSYEIAFLVPLLITVSRLINQKYGRRLEQLYSRSDIVGFLVSLFLAPPTTYVKLEKSPDAILPRRNLDRLPARVSLRFLAQKSLLFYLFLFYLIASFLSGGHLLFIFSVFLPFLVYGAYKRSNQKKVN